MKKSNNEPRRHHYISQFIIKNFGESRMGINTVNYYDIKRKKVFTVPTEEIFAYNDLYRDEVNNFDDPVTSNIDLIAKWKEIPAPTPTDSTPAKTDTDPKAPKVLPKTGNVTGLAIAGIMIVITTMFGIGYFKLRDIK